MKTLNFDVRRMCQLALLIALELLMGYTPLGYLQLGFIAASLLSIPVAVGAIVLGNILICFTFLPTKWSSRGIALIRGRVSLLDVVTTVYRKVF